MKNKICFGLKNRVRIWRTRRHPPPPPPPRIPKSTLPPPRPHEFWSARLGPRRSFETPMRPGYLAKNERLALLWAGLISTEISACCLLHYKGMAYPGYGAPPPGGYGGVSKELVRYLSGVKIKASVVFTNGRHLVLTFCIFNLVRHKKCKLTCGIKGNIRLLFRPSRQHPKWQKAF